MSERLKCFLLISVLIPLMFFLLCLGISIAGGKTLKIWFPLVFGGFILINSFITFKLVLKEITKLCTKP